MSGSEHSRNPGLPFAWKRKTPQGWPYNGDGTMSQNLAGSEPDSPNEVVNKPADVILTRQTMLQE